MCLLELWAQQEGGDLSALGRGQRVQECSAPRSREGGAVASGRASSNSMISGVFPSGNTELCHEEHACAEAAQLAAISFLSSHLGDKGPSGDSGFCSFFL